MSPAQAAESTPRQMWAPWQTLTREEQEESVRQARRKGRQLAELTLRLRRPPQDTPEPAQASLYLRLVLHSVPRDVQRRWHDAGPSVWLGDPRVCAFGAAWEETRRVGLGLPISVTRAARERDLNDAAARLRSAFRTLTETQEQVKALQPPVLDPLRLAMGDARKAEWEASWALETASLLYGDRCYQEDGLP